MPRPVLHALPGMGADHRMFPAPWAGLAGFRAHDWSGHAHTRSIPELAESVCRQAGIQDGDVLVGASLGGMVALEITRLRRIPAVFLIGSAVHPAEIRPIPADLHPLIEVVPLRFARRAAAMFPGELMQMFADSDPGFIRAMCRAIFRWRGAPATTTRIHRVHGRGDLLIAPRTRVDLLLEGRHALALSHASECVHFVRNTLAAGEGLRPCAT
jgi:pimeloyl-ACP methyl ester carboxylesterase